jgi:lipopolysaccharide/colanic/teichoic acid biosynthesis glycosyltransferase
VIQWFILIAAMAGTRIAVRLRAEKSRYHATNFESQEHRKQRVLVVGVNDLTELYLRAVADFAPNSLAIVGILTSESKLHERLLRFHRVLGTPLDVKRVLDELDIHGVTVDRIVVTERFARLSDGEREALRAVERESNIQIDWLIEILTSRDAPRKTTPETKTELVSVVESNRSPQAERQSVSGVTTSHVALRRYHRWKRMADAAVAIILLIVLAPVIAVASLLVAIDVGLPVVFWQQRPGRYGRAFKLYKFRTMRPAHDAEGNRIPDELRSSIIGRFMRRTWLDELPQLYNILIGDMSFVGPRPLLPVDQPGEQAVRLLVRPGLTGWAQINGGRDISPEEKAKLDAWYIQNAWFWLDIKILLRTLGMIMSRGSLNGLASPTPVETTRIRAVESEPTLLTGLSRLAARGAPEAP